MHSIRASYFDGKESTAQAVDLLIEDEGIVLITSPTGEKIESLSLGELIISSRLGNTKRIISLPDGRKLETDDNDSIDAILKKFRLHRTSAFVHYLESRWIPVLISVATFALLLTLFYKVGVPYLAKATAFKIPIEYTQYIGNETMHLLDQTVFSETELSQDRQQELSDQFDAIAQNFPELKLDLIFRKGERFGANAFAIPNGTIVITDEFVSLMTDDGQIVAVLAHEIGHIQNRHGLRTALEGMSLALLISLITGDITSSSSLAVALPSILIGSHYSRVHETEADDFAYTYLKNENIPLIHFADALKRLEIESEAHSAEQIKYLSSHPLTKTRILRFEDNQSE
jgi:Zn-dependent protease with chaperone function